MRATENEQEECMYGFRHKVTTCAAVISAALMVAAPVAAQERGPLALASASYFFVGGKIDPSVEGSPTVGQMYVEFMIPARRRHPYPIVMVHGGSQTGTNFTGTPDGREGWAQYFVRRGYAVYVVDQVARGRSAHWSQVHGAVQPSRLSFVEQRFVAPERFKQWPQAHLHTQWPGTGKPGDPAFDQFYASQFPSIVSFPKQQELNRDALVALLDKIGPAILLTHSQSGAFNWPVADARPNLLKALVRSSRPGRRCTTSRTPARPTGSRTPSARRCRAWPTFRSPMIRRSAPAARSNSSARTRRTSPSSCVAGCRRNRPASCRVSRISRSRSSSGRRRITPPTITAPRPI